jgi:hypothetical protein
MQVNLVDYEFGYGVPVLDAINVTVKRYNERHDKPANMVWVCRADYDELVREKKNGVAVGWNPCSKVRGNVMVGRVE